MSDSISIEKEIRKSYLEYSLSVIIGRAIPDVRDGLKPVHRRILFAMHELGNSWNRPYKKSARVVGDVIGKYHPHGDAAVYDALVRMAQPFAMRDPLVDGQGNFGSIDGDAAAAMRYTEVRMARLTSEFLADIDKETIDFRANYDNTQQEPSVLPTKVPNLLLNGSAGIAVGMATNIPPHNLGELIDGCLLLLDDPDAAVSQLMQHIQGPDFPTAASVFAGQGLREAYMTGRGSVRIRGELHVETRKKGYESIIITEIPYAVNKSSMVEKIAALVNERKLEGVSDLRDESDRKGIRVVVDLKKGVIPDIVINSLYKYTQLETTFGLNMMAVVNNRPQLLNIKQILLHFLDHRREVILRRSRYDLRKAEERAHIVEGLRIAIDNIDEIIAIIRGSEDPAHAKARLIERFELSEAQSQAILDMRLQRLTGLERDKLEAEYAELLKRIEYLKSVLQNEAVLIGVIKDELTEIRAVHATPRRTRILEEEACGIDIEDLIPDEDVVITLSRRGYIKRTTLDNYQQQRRGGKGIAGVHTSDGDIIQNFLVTSNHQFLLIFTNRGKMYQLKAHQVPEGGRTAKGAHIANLLPLEKDEWAASVLSIREFSENRFFFFLTRQGVVKRSSADLYAKCRRTGLIAVGLREGDELIAVRNVSAEDEMILVTAKGLSIRFMVKEVRAMGRGSTGVKGVALGKDDAVVSAVVPSHAREKGGRSQILTISQKGFGKRTKLELYRQQSRGGKGVINMKTTSKTGRVVGATAVREDDEIIVLTSTNKIVRTGVKDISLVGRATQGVRVVRVDNGGGVVAFDIVQETPLGQDDE